MSTDDRTHQQQEMSQTDQNECGSVEFFFDPLCPWAYQASLWIREVRRLTGLEIAWRFFSLEEANLEPGKKHPWEREWSYGWGPMRVGAYLRRQSMAHLDDWYLRIGRALHEEGKKMHRREVAEAIAEEAGYGANLVEEALSDPTTSTEVLQDHRRAVNDYGAFGVPTLVFPDGLAVFGPVVAPAPTGEDALRLWRLTVEWVRFPHLYELKRPKTASDHQHIAKVFTPYIVARDWKTVEKRAP
jgi:protein-disulfide isomerase-like protein with CxxC motif